MKTKVTWPAWGTESERLSSVPHCHFYSVHLKWNTAGWQFTNLRKRGHWTEREEMNKHFQKSDSQKIQLHKANMYYLTTCYMQEKTSEGETIESQSIASLFTNSPRWPFQCFKKILFTFFLFCWSVFWRIPQKFCTFTAIWWFRRRKWQRHFVQFRCQQLKTAAGQT